MELTIYFSWAMLLQNTSIHISKVIDLQEIPFCKTGLTLFKLKKHVTNL